ncbi:methylated-DNA--[protein]-cysteine S-methyltransferase [Thiohalorhabdus sp. Cl-TMA]|uniref:Methylated-DNA--[protein]-cysteine S-methyltransferase n=1 Tax=Thiohalorhabdus methylotrophus TaxID=3242694 RepID=A0ABV4TY77_9GAMM
MNKQESPERGLIMRTPAGPLAIQGGPRGITRVRWASDGIDEDFREPTSPALERARAALLAYFADPRQPRLEVPLAPYRATSFQWRVWWAMRRIPPGSTVTYGELARWLGSSPRAVGNAAGANPWPLIVPCHRVVSRNGLGGYMRGSAGGEGLRIKRWLLAWEGWEGTGEYG